MSITIYDHALPYDTYNIYEVTFYTDNILTLVTNAPFIVDQWLNEIQHIHRRRLGELIVGFDVEWRPNSRRNMENPVATLQLCVGRRCLIFQILHAPNMPRSLINFLGNPNYTFVGVGIEADVDKLLGDHGLNVASIVDLRTLASERLGAKELKNSGLKMLAMRVLGREMEKPKNISRSRWDNLWLTAPQVQYACVDAFISFEVGRRLYYDRFD